MSHAYGMGHICSNWQKQSQEEVCLGAVGCIDFILFISDRVDNNCKCAVLGSVICALRIIRPIVASPISLWAPVFGLRR